MWGGWGAPQLHEGAQSSSFSEPPWSASAPSEASYPLRSQTTENRRFSRVETRRMLLTLVGSPAEVSFSHGAQEKGAEGQAAWRRWPHLCPATGSATVLLHGRSAVAWSEEPPNTQGSPPFGVRGSAPCRKPSPLHGPSGPGCEEAP